MCTSQCSNDDLCPERVKSDEMNDFPCVPNVHNDNEFETFIVSWLIEIKETPCRLELLNNNSCGINAQWIPKWLIYIYLLHVSCGQQSYGWYPLSGWPAVHEFLEFL